MPDALAARRLANCFKGESSILLGGVVVALPGLWFLEDFVWVTTYELGLDFRQADSIRRH